MEVASVRFNACDSEDHLHNETSEPSFEVYFMYVYRIIYAVGLLGNLLALVVWARSGLRSTPVVYFQAICVADSLVLIMHPLESFHNEHVQGVCQLVHMFFLAVQVFAILLVLGLSVERYIELCHPMSAGHLISYKRTVRLILLLAVLSVLFSLGEAYVWHVQDNVMRCQPRDVVKASSMWTYALLVLVILFLCPLVAVVVFNLLVVRKIWRKRKCSGAYSVSMVPDKHDMNLAVTFVSLYLAVCELVYASVHIGQYLLIYNGESGNSLVLQEGESGAKSDMPLTGRWHSFYIHSLPLLIVDVIALTSYAVDVTIFTLCSNTFRRSVRGLFDRCRQQELFKTTRGVGLRAFRRTPSMHL